MAITSFAEFKTHVTKFAWRENDDEFSTDFSSYVQMADSDLNTRLRCAERFVETTITPQGESYDLDDNVRSVLSLVSQEAPKVRFRSTTVNHLREMQAAGNSLQVQPFYAIQGNTLLLVGPFSASSPGNLILMYRRNVPDFETDDTSWLVDNYLQLYTYAVLVHAGIARRDSAMVDQWSGAYEGALSSVNDEFEYNRFGTPTEMQPQKQMPRRNYGRW